IPAALIPRVTVNVCGLDAPVMFVTCMTSPPQITYSGPLLAPPTVHSVESVVHRSTTFAVATDRVVPAFVIDDASVDEDESARDVSNTPTCNGAYREQFAWTW